jgi:hypothetical protein
LQDYLAFLINFPITYFSAAGQIAFAGFLRKPAKKDTQLILLILSKIAFSIK